MKEKPMVSNPQGQAIPTRLTDVSLGKAMSQLNLAEIPYEHRVTAVMEHFFRVMADNVLDKDVSHELHLSRALRQKGKQDGQTSKGKS